MKRSQRGTVRVRRMAICITLIVFGIVLMAALPSGILVVAPGPVVPLGNLVRIDAHPPTGEGIFMVSVAATEASFLRAILEAAFTDNELWDKADLFQGMSEGEYDRWAHRQMEESKARAVRLALSYVDAECPEGEFGVAIDSQDVGGPSAALAFALEIIDRYSGGRLSKGRKIAATGVLSDEGTVLPVGGVRLKAIACKQAGIEILMVPAANVDEASQSSGSMKVLGVSDLIDAVTTLMEAQFP